MLGPILGAVGSIAGSLLSKSASDKNNATIRDNARRQEELQREFAQSGIQWKVDDAKKAGIHPLYALGANTVSYSPNTIGQSMPDYSGLGNAGQNIGRAIDSTSTQPQKQTAFQAAIQQTQLTGAQLDNEIKRAELAAKRASLGNTPAFPTAPGTTQSHFDGQGDAVKIEGPKIKLETRRDVSNPGNPEYVAGTGPGVSLYKNSTGGFSPVVPPELAESFEADPIGMIDWMIRNRYLPNFGANTKPEIARGHDEEVYWNHLGQDWKIRKKYNPYGARRTE